MARIQPSFLDTGLGSVPVAGQRAGYNRFTSLGALINRLPFRKGVGLDLLSIGNIVVVTLALLALQVWDNIHFSLWTLFGGGVIYANHAAVIYFAVVWAAFALFERVLRLQEEKRGVEPHTLSPGVSRFGLREFLPLSEKAIAVAVEPGLAFLAGAVVRRLGFSMLGWIIIASSLCFALSEWRFYSQEKRHKRDLRNLDKEARREADLVKPRAEAHGGLPGSEALRTGIDGLENEIANRKQGKAESAQGGAL